MKGLSGYTDDSGAWINITPGSLYTKWEPKKVRIILDKNEGDTDGSAVATVGSAELTDYRAATRVGYVLTGYQWGVIVVIDSDGNLCTDATDYTDGDGKWIKFDEDEVTLYAHWRMIHYNIAYDGNGGTGSIPDREMYYNDRWTLMSDGFTRTNYRLVGWNTSPDGTGQAYDLGAEIFNLTLVDDATVTMYAQWEGEPYYVAFNGNGSTSGTMSNQTLHYAQTSTLTQNAYARTGYVFAGWNTDDEGNGTAYADEAEVTNLVNAGQTLQLYAQWTPITYYVAFALNGGTGGAPPAPLTKNYGEVWNLPKCDFFFKTNYDFASWNTIDNGSGTPYADQAEVSNLTTEDGATVTLYAQWIGSPYTVKFRANGGTGTMDDQSIRYDVSTDLTANAYTRSGYTFKYWTIGESDTGNYYEDGAEVLNLADGHGSVTLYAQWTPIKYTITLIAGEGGENGTATVTFNSNDFTVTKEPTLPGFEVMQYWATDSGGTVAKDDGTLYNYAGWVSGLKWCNSAENQSLYVNWYGKEYEVQFRLNGGNGDDFVKKIRYTADVDSIKVDIPTREGYSFLGYFTSEDGGIQVFTNLGRAKDYAGGWTTDGWNNYSDEQILYAHWMALPTGIEIYDGDQTTEKWLTIYYDNTRTSGGSLPTPETGYKFEGFYADENCTTKVLNGDCTTVSGVSGWTDSEGRWKVSDDETRLYVKYTLKTTTLTLNSNGGEENGSAVATYSSGTLADYVAATRAGHTLLGYYTAAAYSGFMVIDEEGNLCDSSYVTDGKWNVTSETMTLYAWWSVNQYTVTYETGDGTDIGPAEYNYGATITPPADPERTGYTFAGWSPEIPATMPADHITVTALWTANTYKVTIDPNGGTGTFEFNVTYGTSNDIPDMTSSFSKTGHSVGWMITVTQNGIDEVISHDVVVATGQNEYRFVRCDGYTVIEDSMVKWIHDGDVTFYLTWEPNVYTGILSSDGYGTDGSFEVTYGFNTVNVVHATAAGYDRAGYYTEPKGAGSFALTGDLETTYHFAYGIPGITDAEGKWIYTGTEPVTLYSKWEPQLYPVTVDKNGGDQDGWYQATYMDDHFLVISQVTRQNATLVGIYADAACSADKQIADKDGRFLSVTVAGFLDNGHWVCLIDDVKTYAKWAVNPAPTNTDTVDFVDTSTDTVMIDMSSAAVAEAINDASKTEVNVSGDGWKMEIPKEILSGATGTVSVEARSLSGTDLDALPAEVRSIVQGKTVFSLSLTDDNGAISFNGKSITVSLPYVLKDGESASDVKVFFINASNQAEQVDARYDADTKCAVFTTDHFSTWYVDVVPDDSPSGGGPGIGAIIGIVVAVIAVAAVVAVVVMKKTKKA